MSWSKVRNGAAWVGLREPGGKGLSFRSNLARPEGDAGGRSLARPCQNS
ncbi:hypothetical protein ABIB82_002925 [Bradyrhizobium sp. i1.8.4]